MRASSSLTRFCLVLVVAFISVSGLVAGPLDLRLELLTGMPLPGVEGTLAGVSGVRSNQAGDFVFLASLRYQDGSEPHPQWGVFLKRGEEIRKVIVERESLPGGASFSLISSGLMLDINEAGTVAIVIKEGILLHDTSGLRWLVQAGAGVSGSSLSIQELLFLSYASSSLSYPYAPFLNENNEVAFEARLSDGRVGVFRATSAGSILPVALPGDPCPDRPGSNFGDPLKNSQPRLIGDSLIFITLESASSAGVYLHRAGALRTIVATGDTLPGIGAVTAIGQATANAAGQVAVSLTTGEPDGRRLVLWSAPGVIGRILSKSDLPGFGPDTLVDLVGLSVDEYGRLFFAAVGGNRDFIYLSDGQGVEKIVADGDQTPLGGTFYLPTPPPPVIPPPGAVYPQVMPTNGYGELVFMASVRETDHGRIPFLWSHGLIQPIPSKDESIDGIGDRVVSSLSVSAFDGSTLLLSASLCCDGVQALVSAVGASPKRSYVPLIAQGVAGTVRYRTHVDLVNHSPFPGFALLQRHWEDGSSPAALPGDIRFLEPGSVTRVYDTASANPVVRGYLEVTIEGGAHVSPVASLEVSEYGRLLSKTVLLAVATRTEVDIPIERAGGEKAFALSNPGEMPNQVLLELIDEAGSVQAEVAKDLLPGVQQSFLLADLFPGLDPSFLGHLRARSDKPFLLGGFSLTGFQLATVPAPPASSRSLRDLSLKNLYPGEVERVVASRSGAVAFITPEENQTSDASTRYTFLVVREGQLYDVLSQAAQTQEGTQLSLPRIKAWPLGFSGDDSLYFLASRSEDPYLGDVGLFKWRPGRTDQILTSHDRFPDGSRIVFNTLYSICPFTVGTDGQIYFPTHVFNDLGLLTGTSIFKYDSSFHKLFSLPRGAGIAEISETDGAITVLDGAGLWLFRNGELLPIVEMGTTSTGEQVGGIVHAERSQSGNVYFASQKGLYLWDQETTQKIAVVGEPAPGLPGYLFQTVGIDAPAFRVNRNDRMVYPARLRNVEGSSSGNAFFLVDTTASQQTVLIPPWGKFDYDGWYLSGYNGYEWTDDDELILSFRSSASYGQKTVAFGPDELEPSCQARCRSPAFMTPRLPSEPC